MKERVDPNYFVDLSYSGQPAEVDAHLPDTYSIRVNDFVWIEILPWFPRGPWPAQPPEDPGAIKNKEQAAWFAATGPAVVIAPADDGIEVREALIRDDDIGSTVFRLQPAAYRRLVGEIAARLERDPRLPDGPRTRLSNLEGTELGRFLTEELPRADLDSHYRSVLCLP